MQYYLTSGVSAANYTVHLRAEKLFLSGLY
jgi:hypothetical protein